MANSSRRLVLICGLPASGKSTLARQPSGFDREELAQAFADCRDAYLRRGGQEPITSA